MGLRQSLQSPARLHAVEGGSPAGFAPQMMKNEWEDQMENDWQWMTWPVAKFILFIRQIRRHRTNALCQI